MEPLNTSQTVFTVFFAIMWGTLANVWPRWKAFDLSLTIYEGDRAPQRWALSFVFLNLAPIVFFVSIMRLLREWTLDERPWPTMGKLIVVMFQPFVLIGLYWVWASILEAFPSHFYSSPFVQERYPNLLKEQDLDPRRVDPNLAYGLLYIGVPLAALSFAIRAQEIASDLALRGR